MSFLKISFKDYEVQTLKRSEKFSNTDFMAVCGGLLGLFLGVSALSIIEFIYYYTLRLYWSLQQWKFKRAVITVKPKNITHIPVNTTNTVNIENSTNTVQPTILCRCRCRCCIFSNSTKQFGY